VLLAILGTVRILNGLFGDDLWTRSLSHFWEERCLDYRLPGDRVAYVAAPAGLILPEYLGDFSVGSRSTWTGTVGASPYPIELAELHSLTAPPIDVSWTDLPGPVFLHALHDTAGKRWMVSVYALVNNPRGWWTLVACTREPMHWRGKRTSPVITTACWPMPKTPHDVLAVFAGQPVPSDASTFTLQIRLNGRDQLVRGTILEDGKIDFRSSTGLSPWSTDRAGPLVLPAVMPGTTTGR
jgi:hypothetical protein